MDMVPAFLNLGDLGISLNRRRLSGIREVDRRVMNGGSYGA